MTSAPDLVTVPREVLDGLVVHLREAAYFCTSLTELETRCRAVADQISALRSDPPYSGRPAPSSDPEGGARGVQTSIARKQTAEATSDSATEFSSLQEANIARQQEWDPDNRITLAYRGNELAGEVGEACNVIKKLERERLGINGSRDTVEHLLEELADSVICSYLVAMHVGGDLEAAIVAKFNATSEKMGLKTRMRFAKSDGGVEGHAGSAALSGSSSSSRIENPRGMHSCRSIEATAAGIKPGPSDPLLSKTLTEGEKKRPQMESSRESDTSSPGQAGGDA